MAKSKYDSVIKPNYENIRSMISEKGMTEKDVSKTLGVHVGTWFKYKNEYKEFDEFIKNCKESKVKDNLEFVMDRLDRPKPQTIIDLLKEKIMRRNEDKQLVASSNEIMSVAKFLYPDIDWYRLNEEEKTKIERERLNQDKDKDITVVINGGIDYGNKP